MTFPETIPATRAGWATLSYLRKPNFKVHATRGLAFSAYSNKRPDSAIAIYQLVDTQWVLYLKYEPEPNCPRCGSAFDYRYNYRYLTDTGKKAWEEDIICRKCHDEDEQKRRQERALARDLAELERLTKLYGERGEHN